MKKTPLKAATDVNVVYLSEIVSGLCPKTSIFTILIWNIEDKKKKKIARTKLSTRQDEQIKYILEIYKVWYERFKCT